jgi:hypothetical protein
MPDSDRNLNWPIALFVTIALSIGLLVIAFIMALYWSVGDIRRVTPLIADYSPDPQGSNRVELPPLSAGVIDAARVDRGEVDFSTPGVPPLTPTPQVGDSPTPLPPTSTPLPSQPVVSTATSTATLLPSVTLPPTNPPPPGA